MAVRSLGQLTIDLVAKIGGFTRGMTEAERVADQKSRDIARKNRQRAKEVETAWKNATGLIAGAFAGISIANIFQTFIRESIEAQNEQAQLAAVLKSTGQAAGFTADQLNKMSAELAGRSIFSEGDITKAQTRLLGYVNIVGQQFPEAMQAVIDMATRMGMTVEQAAETVGRALDIPSRGMVSLQRQGFKFTESQIAAAKELERTGRVADAQAIVLDELKVAYEGAAEAARNTLGGSVAALQEQIRTLLTGSDGNLEGLRSAIEQITVALKNPETQRAIDDLLSGILKFSVFSIDAADGVVRVFSAIGKTIGAAAAQVAAIVDGEFRQAWEIGKQWKQDIDALLMRPMLRNAPPAPALGSSSAGGPGGSTAPSSADIAALAAAAKLREERERGAKQAIQQAQAYLDNLKRQLQATEDLSVAETVLRDIQSGRVKLVGGITQESLLAVARQIDANKALKQSEEDRIKAMQAIAEIQQRIDSAAQDEVERLIQSNQALREEIELLGLDAEARAAVERARLSSAIALKEEELAMAQNAGASQTVIESLERQVRLLRQREELVGRKGFVEKQIEETSKLVEFQKRAVENIQNALGDTFYNAMQGNFDNIGDAFKQMLDRMVAEAAAAQLARHLFGSLVQGGSGSGLFGNILGAAAGALFGSAGMAALANAMPGDSLDNFLKLNNNFAGRAAGGAVLPWQMYRINENGPEMLEMNGSTYLMMGNRSGNVVPAGGMNVVNNFSVQGPVNRQTEAQIGKAASRGLQRAQRWL